MQTLGVVSFLNALPLYDGLTDDAGVWIRPEVPANLLDLLLRRQCDAALLPVVDYWRHRDRLEPLGDACIGSDGETLTVRVFSRRPVEGVTRLHVDGDSHTSVVLARLVWRELYGRDVDVVSWREGEEAESVLLIGDKVVRGAPRGYGFEVDLGAAWKHLTGLPFVFAAWYGRSGENHGELAARLEAARDAGVAGAARIALHHATRHGWPAELAVQYLCRIMKYTISPAMRAGMERFFTLVDQHGLLA
jgi:chorismate dehydratase